MGFYVLYVGDVARILLVLDLYLGLDFSNLDMCGLRLSFHGLPLFREFLPH